MRTPVPTAPRSLAIALIVLFAAALAPAHALGQQPQGMPSQEMMKRFQDPEAMQQMAAQMEKMQKCMERIDQKELDALKKRGEAASKEIEKLCKAGKKDEALARAMEIGQEMRSDATVKQLRACTKGMEEMMKGMPMGQVPGMTDDNEPTEQDICNR